MRRSVIRPYPIPFNEAARLDALAALGVRDGARDRELDEIAGWVHAMIGAEVAAVTLVGAERQVFAALAGPSVLSPSRDLSICAHVVAREAPLVIEDARRDPVFRDHPMVAGPPHLRFYVGAPIRLSNRMVMGSVCAIGTTPRPAPPPAVMARIADLADLVAFILEARASKGGRADAMARATDRAQRDFLALVSHELRAPLRAARALGDVVRPPGVQRDAMPALRVSGTLMTRLVENVTTFSQVRSGSLLPKEATLPAGRVLEAVRSSAAPRLAAVGCPPPRISAPPGLALRADPALLTLALDCLADDALADGARSLRLSASADGGGATLSVEASGSSARRADAGGQARVGLTLARRLIELHAGELLSRGGRTRVRSTILRLPSWRVVGPAAASGI